MRELAVSYLSCIPEFPHVWDSSFIYQRVVGFASTFLSHPPICEKEGKLSQKCREEINGFPLGMKSSHLPSKKMIKDVKNKKNNKHKGPMNSNGTDECWCPMKEKLTHRLLPTCLPSVLPYPLKIIVISFWLFHKTSSRTQKSLLPPSLTHPKLLSYWETDFEKTKWSEFNSGTG